MSSELERNNETVLFPLEQKTFSEGPLQASIEGDDDRRITDQK
jgi:hypothetical protein